MYTVSQYDLGTLKGSLTIQGVTSLVSQEGRSFIFFLINF